MSIEIVLLRTREKFLRLFFDPECDPRSSAGLRRDFLAFAVLVREGRASGADPKPARSP
ncbi:MAG TPA: hypothetical protein VF530_16400 [Planctomycetota bacterium]